MKTSNHIVRVINSLSRALLSRIQGETLRENTDDLQVICVLLPKDGTWCEIQLRLLRASLKAGVTRFAPAEFGCGPLATPHISMLSAQMPVWEACKAAAQDAEASSRKFEWACFHVGLFMNYLGNGCKNEVEALAGKSDDGEFMFYMKDIKAKIPLTKDGKIPKITLTEIGDVGRFVGAACELPYGEWKENFGMVGSTLGMDEIVDIIEEVRGKKMNVEYRAFEDVRKEKEECKNEMKLFWLELEEVCAMDEEGSGIISPILNGICPNVKPMTAEGYIRKFWNGQ
jgi:hypothetical protein